MVIYIYGLFDPRDGAIRYVGKTVNPKARNKYHHTPSSIGENKHRSLWIQELRSIGLRANFKVLEECTDENWRDRERYWIQRFGGPGMLLNLRKGGESTYPVSGIGHIVRESTREKLRLAAQKQYSNPEAKRKHTDGMRKWWEALSSDKRQRVREGSEHSRRKGIGVKAMQERIASMSESERADWIARSHAWLSDPANSEKQRQKSLKRWEKQRQVK